jgi:hypothetical protein
MVPVFVLNFGLGISISLEFGAWNWNFLSPRNHQFSTPPLIPPAAPPDSCAADTAPVFRRPGV